MLIIAYLANQFPSAMEPYVGDEIRELRRHGAQVVPCSLRRPSPPNEFPETLTPASVRPRDIYQTVRLGFAKRGVLPGIFHDILAERQSPIRRMKALLHTALGACLAAGLYPQRVQHIHIHHGYFAAWVGMVAARLLGISYSFTLHGSDLLLHKAYLEVKLRHCRFCFTVSEFNRRHILEHYPGVDPEKIVVQRLGVEVPDLSRREPTPGPMVLLSVGRLHPVKDHAFLVRACHRLKRQEISFLCQIAGDGPERPHLARLVTDLGLENEVQFLGQVSRERLRLLYRAADLVVLTSRSEGIPLVLMEAMAQGTPVLAPAITGIPELVLPGQTGFLYEPGSLESFVSQLREFKESSRPLLRRRAWQQVARHFHREKNLARFATLFLERCAPQPQSERPEHADLVLQ